MDRLDSVIQNARNVLLKGDVAGHIFHGNRYTGGIGGNPAERLGITSKSKGTAMEGFGRYDRKDDRMVGGVGPKEANYIHSGIRVFADAGGRIVDSTPDQRDAFLQEMNQNSSSEATRVDPRISLDLGWDETKAALSGGNENVLIALDKDGKLAGAVSYDKFAQDGFQARGMQQIKGIGIGDLGSLRTVPGVGSALTAALAAKITMMRSTSSLSSYQIRAAYAFHARIGRWLTQAAVGDPGQRAGASQWNAEDIKKVQAIFKDAGGPALIVKPVKKMVKGDVTGHEFHGNRYTGGLGALKEPTDAQHERDNGHVDYTHIARIERNLKAFRDAGGTVEHYSQPRFSVDPAIRQHEMDAAEALEQRLHDELEKTLTDIAVNHLATSGRDNDEQGEHFTDIALTHIGNPNYQVFIARDADGNIAGAINVSGGVGLSSRVGYLGSTHIIPGTGSSLVAAVANWANQNMDAHGGGQVDSEYTPDARGFHTAIGRTLDNDYSGSSHWSNIDTYQIAKMYREVMSTTDKNQLALDFGKRIDSVLEDMLYTLNKPTHAMFKGESAGHDFRGNRYTGGIPGGRSHIPDGRFPAHWQDARGQSQMRELLNLHTQPKDDLWDDDKERINSLIKDLGIRDGRMFNMPDHMVMEFIEHPPTNYVPSQTRNPAVEAALRLVETEEFAHRDLELGHIIDPQTGKLIGSVTSNEPDRVTFGPDDMTRLQGAIFTHNHPANVGRTIGGTLSGIETMDPSGDLRAAQSYGMAEVRAVDQQYIYSMRPPVGQATFRPSDSMRLNDTREDVWANMQEKQDKWSYDQNMASRVQAARSAGDSEKELYLRTLVQDHASALSHEAWIEFAAKTGYQYTRTPRVVAKSVFFKGEAAGHDFRGNRFTGGIPGGGRINVEVKTPTGLRILRDLARDASRYTPTDLRHAADLWDGRNASDEDKKVAGDLRRIANKLEAQEVQAHRVPQSQEADPHKITEAELLRRIRASFAARQVPAPLTITKADGERFGNLGGVDQTSAEYIAKGAQMFKDAGGKLLTNPSRDQLNEWARQIDAEQAAKGYSVGRNYTRNGVSMQRDYTPVGPPQVLFAIDKYGKIAGSITWRRAIGNFGPEVHIGVLGSVGNVKGVGSALTLAVAHYAASQDRVITSSYISSARAFHAAIGRRLDFAMSGNSGWNQGDMKNLDKVWDSIKGGTLMKNPSDSLFSAPATPAPAQAVSSIGARIGTPRPA